MAIRVPATMGKIIHIGRAGENLATIVTFDVSDWIADFGSGGTFNLYVEQGSGNIYPQEIETNGSTVEWNVTSTNTAVVGLGKCELFYNKNNVVVKSAIYDIVVTDSLDASAAGEPPTPIKSWLDNIVEMTDKINNAYQYAEQASAAVDWIENMEVDAETGGPGTLAEAATTSDENGLTINFTIPRGTVFWTTSVNPTFQSNYYSFERDNLSGPQNADPFVEDFILCNDYLYKISEITLSEVRASSSSRIYIKGEVGNTGSPAGFGTISVTVDSNTGSPTALVTSNGPDTAKNLNFSFFGLKGERGERGTGLQISGTYASQQNLPTPASALVGNVYIAGSPGNYWYVTKNGTYYSWTDGGPISGTSITLVDWTES